MIYLKLGKLKFELPTWNSEEPKRVCECLNHKLCLFLLPISITPSLPGQ